jgi:hypothetical protein
MCQIAEMLSEKRQAARRKTCTWRIEEMGFCYLKVDNAPLKPKHCSASQPQNALGRFDDDRR